MTGTAKPRLHRNWDQADILAGRYGSGLPGQISAGDRTEPPAGLWNALIGRMKGPGGLYNVGNVLALGTGLGVQIAMATGGETAGSGAILDALRAYFIGSPGATALTFAILIFIASGEMYHRAWSRGAPPNRRLNRHGDLLSAIAAAVLTISLAVFGDILLATASGLLLAAGKLGSALVPEEDASPKAGRWPRRFRLAVVASCVPALVLLAIKLLGLVDSAGTTPADSLVLTPVMLVCYLLWIRADLMLIQPSVSTSRNAGTR